jgi:hypothetical protein
VGVAAPLSIAAAFYSASAGNALIGGLLNGFGGLAKGLGGALSSIGIGAGPSFSDALPSVNVAGLYDWNLQPFGDPINDWLKN